MSQNAARRVRAWIAERYATADPRSLGLLRIALGTILTLDVARRIPDLSAHYSNAGWLPNHVALHRPLSPHLFSLHLALSTPNQVLALLLAQMTVSALLTVGYRTRAMHLMSAVLITSLDSRTILLENGGFVVLNLLTVWTLFLPLGRRLSVDAWLRSWRGEVEGRIDDLNRPLERDAAPVVSLAVMALIAQWTVIYFFNTVHKNGATWSDGTAVYYFFQQDRMLTSFGGWLRQYVPLGVMKAMTYGTLVIEGGAAVLIASPFFHQKTRMLAWILAIVLHSSIAAVVELGAFSWVMICVFFAFIPSSVWRAARHRSRRRRKRCQVLLDPNSAASIGLGRLLRRLDLLGRVRFVADAHAGSDLIVVVGDSRFAGPRAAKELGRALLGGALVRAFPGVVTRLVRRGLSGEFPMGWLSSRVTPGQSQLPEEPSAAAVAFARLSHRGSEVLVAFLIFASALQVLIENPAVPATLKPNRPKWLEAVVLYPRLFQGWSMFAPNPPQEDGKIVVEAVTVDGRRIDPLTGEAPDYGVQPKGGFHFDQMWGDLHRRLAEPKFAGFLPDFARISSATPSGRDGPRTTW